MSDLQTHEEHWLSSLLVPPWMAAVEFLRDNVFADNLETDERSPSFFFTVPFLGMYGVSGFIGLFWAQLAVITLLQSLAGMAIGILLYIGVAKKRGTPTAALVGGGLICPFLLILPFVIIDLLEIGNPALLIATSSNSAIMLFRCLEVMFATTPKFAEEGLGIFLCYFCTVAQFQWNPTTEMPILASRGEVMTKVGSVMLRFVESSLLYSIMVPCDYQPFPAREIKGFVDLLWWGNLANSYLVGALLKITLEGGLTAVGAIMSAYTGLSTVDVNLYPLTATTSPSDFWGRRWNRLVSNGLKRAVFKPLRMSGLSRPLAALGTFMASGLLHEYILIVAALYHPSRAHSPSSPPSYGSHLVFFLWNAVVLVTDGLLRGTKTIACAERYIPSPLRTAMVLMTVLPVVHLFTDEYVNMGFYSAFSLGFPRFYKVANQ